MTTNTRLEWPLSNLRSGAADLRPSPRQPLGTSILPLFCEVGSWDSMLPCVGPREVTWHLSRCGGVHLCCTNVRSPCSLGRSHAPGAAPPHSPSPSSADGLWAGAPSRLLLRSCTAQQGGCRHSHLSNDSEQQEEQVLEVFPTVKREVFECSDPCPR